MNTPAFRRLGPALLALTLTAVSAAHGLTVTTNQTFNVQPGGRLQLAADRGSVEITTGDTPTVQVTVTREVKRTGDEEARRVLDSHRLAFHQEGDTVSVKAELTSDGGFWKRWGSKLQVKYAVVVPKRFDLNVKTAGGSIKVADLEGMMELGTAGGSISVGNITGTVQADTAGGSIKVASATGPVNTHTSGGSIELGRMGGTVKAGTAGGSIRIASAAGAVKAETSGGSIHLGDMAGPVKAGTAGGSITARFTQAPAEESSLGTSGGSVTVYLADKLALDLDAETSGGGVSSDVPVTIEGKASRSRLKGQINGGGTRLKLRTAGGGIHIRKLADAKD